MATYYIQSSSNDCVIDIRGGPSKPTDGTELDAFNLWNPHHANQLWTLEEIVGSWYWIQSPLKDPAGYPLVIAISGAVDPVAEGTKLVVARINLTDYQFQAWNLNVDTLGSPNVIQTAYAVGPSASHLVINIGGNVVPPTSGTGLDVWENDGKPRQLWKFVSV